MAGFQDPCRLTGNESAKLETVAMAFAISDDRLHELRALLVRKDEFDLDLFAK